MKSCRLILVLLGTLPAFAEDMQWVDDAAIQNAKKALVNVQVEATTSVLGFFASEDGLVVTPASPLEDAKQVVITTSANDKISDCRLVAIDLEKNLAVLATGRKAPSHLVVSPRPASVGETCAMIFGFTSGLEAKAADGKLLARHEGLNHEYRSFVDYWIAARSPSGTGLLGAAVITRDARLAGICLRQEIDQGPAQQERVLIAPETSITPLLVAAREARKPLLFPVKDVTSDDGLAAADPDANAGTLLLMAGDFKTGLERLRAALKRQPRNTVIMYGLAQGLLMESNFGKTQCVEARMLLENASRLDPRHLRVRMLLGQVLGRLGEIEKAIQSLEKLTQDFPKLAEAWVVLADTLQHEGRKVEAVPAARKCTELEPESLSAWSMYAGVLAEAGKFDEANKARDHVNELESLLFKLKYSAPHRR